MGVITSGENFLTLLRRSGVLDAAVIDEQVSAFRATGGSPDEARPLAEFLVQTRALTRFQAANLIQGKWRNLVLNEKYKLLDLLGSGGMGQVYLCEHVLMRRRVALKVLPGKSLTSSSAVQRFLREARAVAALDHPNIVRAYDIDRADRLYFLVMEYVDGVNLYELVSRAGRLDVGKAALYAAQAASGLNHAHQAGWCHRDIKPGNLLVDRAGTVKIADLGLAKYFHGDTDPVSGSASPRAVLGTADYLAPEQVEDFAGADIRADIYSLGATLYCLLAGVPPFAEGTVASKLARLQAADPPPIRQLRPEVYDSLAAVLRKMMARDRTARYQTPAEVVEALMPFVQGVDPAPPGLAPARPVQAGPGSTTREGRGGPTPLLTPTERAAPPPVRPPRTRWRWVVAGGAAVVAGAVLLLVAPLFRPPDSAGLPDPAVPALAEIARFTGHDGAIESVAFTADGRRAVSAAQDGTLRVWDVTTAKEIARGTGHVGMLRGLTLLPDGRAVTSGVDQTARLWELDSGHELRSFKGHNGPVLDVAGTADGRTLLTAGYDQTVRLWDVATARELKRLTGHGGLVYCVAVFRDGKRGVSGGADGTVRLWNLVTGAEMRKVKVGDTVWRLSLAADGRRVAFGAGPRAYVWDCTTDQLTRLEPAGGPPAYTNDGQPGGDPLVPAAVFTPDGRHVVTTGHDGLVRLWDAASGREVTAALAHRGQALAVAVSPDGRFALSGGRDKTLCLLRLPDVAVGRFVGELVRVEGHTAAVENVAFTPEGRKLVSAGQDGTLRVWDAATGRELTVCVGQVGLLRGVTTLPDGRRALSSGSDGTVRLWDLEDGRELKRFAGHAGGAQFVVSSADGRRVLSGGNDGMLRLWDVESGAQIQEMHGHGGGVQWAAFLPDGRRAVSGGTDHSLRVWDFESGAELKKLAVPGGVWRLHLAPDGRRVAFTCAETVRVWDVETDVVRVFGGDCGTQDGVGFTPDGRHVLSSGHDGAIRIWDATSGAEVRKFVGHTNQALGVTVAPDGRTAASCGRDNAIRIWQLPEAVWPKSER